MGANSNVCRSYRGKTGRRAFLTHPPTPILNRVKMPSFYSGNFKIFKNNSLGQFISNMWLLVQTKIKNLEITIEETKIKNTYNQKYCRVCRDNKWVMLNLSFKFNKWVGASYFNRNLFSNFSSQESKYIFTTVNTIDTSTTKCRCLNWYCFGNKNEKMSGEMSLTTLGCASFCDVTKQNYLFPKVLHN